MTADNDTNKGLSRLRAAAGLMPIIESSLMKAQMDSSRALTMCRFCEWSLENDETDPETLKLKADVLNGLNRINAQLKLRSSNSVDAS